MRLGRIGFDNVTGYLQGGMTALENRPELVRNVPRITAQALADQLQAATHSGVAGPMVIDVRSEKEYRGGHIAGSRNLPLSHLSERLAEIPSNQPVVVHCEGGYRSAIAASLLSAAGRTNVYDMVGGFKAWLASQLPSETAELSATH